MISMHIEFVLHSQSIRFVRLDYEHAQSDRKSMNCRLLVLDLPRDFVASQDENGVVVERHDKT